MSDLLTKGVEMPTSCHECRMYEADIYYCSTADRVIDIPDSSEGRCAFCPLVPVPPHGRLIDADALADVFRGFIAMYDSCTFSQLAQTDKARRDELQAALAEVINAPTIIPAEEGE